MTNTSYIDAIGIERLSPYAENPIVTRVPYKRNSSIANGSSCSTFVYVAVFDAVFNEHAGFGVSFSLDGVSGWTKGQMVAVPQGCRTPLGLLAATAPNTYFLHFTRRFASCNSDPYGGNANAKQVDNCGGWGGSWPTMCAPAFAAQVRLHLKGDAQAVEFPHHHQAAASDAVEPERLLI